MKTDEVQKIIENAGNLNLSQMEVGDQITYLSAVNDFAEKLKPLTEKYLSGKEIFSGAWFRI